MTEPKHDAIWDVPDRPEEITERRAAELAYGAARLKALYADLTPELAPEPPEPDKFTHLKAKARELRAKGFVHRAIAEMTGVAPANVYRWVRK